MWRKGNLCLLWVESTFVAITEISVEAPEETAVGTIPWCSSSTSGYISQGNKISMLKYICTSKFTEALFIMAKTDREPSSVSIDRGIDKNGGIYIQWNPGTLRKRDILLLVTTWMDLEDITLNEINQAQEEKCCRISFMCRILKKKKVDCREAASGVVGGPGEWRRKSTEGEKSRV